MLHVEGPAASFLRSCIMILSKWNHFSVWNSSVSPCSSQRTSGPVLDPESPIVHGFLDLLTSLSVSFPLYPLHCRHLSIATPCAPSFSLRAFAQAVAVPLGLGVPVPGTPHYPSFWFLLTIILSESPWGFSLFKREAQLQRWKIGSLNSCLHQFRVKRTIPCKIFQADLFSDRKSEFQARRSRRILVWFVYSCTLAPRRGYEPKINVYWSGRQKLKLTSLVHPRSTKEILER